jgi:hypothetical protein
VFILPWPRDVYSERNPGFRSLVSLAAGIAVAYVFIDLLPEFSGLGDELLHEEALELPFPEYVVYMAALLGFMLFYGLERLVRWHGPEERLLREGAAVGRQGEPEVREEEDEAQEWAAYRVRLLGMAAYAGLILYLLTAGLRQGSEEGLVAYVVAMLFHFVGVRHGLRHEFPDAYMSKGRWVMAGAAVLGAALGLALELPLEIEALLLGVLGGMVIMNTTVMELPSEKEGRFGMFVLGGVLYAALLMLV